MGGRKFLLAGVVALGFCGVPITAQANELPPELRADLPDTVVAKWAEMTPEARERYRDAQLAKWLRQPTDQRLDEMNRLLSLWPNEPAAQKAAALAHNTGNWETMADADRKREAQRIRIILSQLDETGVQIFRQTIAQIDNRPPAMRDFYLQIIDGPRRAETIPQRVRELMGVRDQTQGKVQPRRANPRPAAQEATVVPTVPEADGAKDTPKKPEADRKKIER